MKKLIILSLFLIGINSSAQTTEEIQYMKQLEASSSDTKYKTFVKELLEFISSDANLKEAFYTDAYINSIGTVDNNREVCSLSNDDFEKWIKKNLNKTNFSSVDEAIDITTNYRKYKLQNEEINRENSLKIGEYKNKYGLIIHYDLLNKITLIELNGRNKLASK